MRALAGNALSVVLGSGAVEGAGGSVCWHQARSPALGLLGLVPSFAAELQFGTALCLEEREVTSFWFLVYLLTPRVPL